MSTRDGTQVGWGKVYGFSGPVLSLAISPCGGFIVAGCMDGSLALMSVDKDGEGGTVSGVTRELGTIKVNHTHFTVIVCSILYGLPPHLSDRGS